MRPIKILSEFCKQRKMAIENILDPMTDKECDARDHFISMARQVHGMKTIDISNLIDVNPEYVLGVTKQ